MTYYALEKELLREEEIRRRFDRILEGRRMPPVWYIIRIQKERYRYPKGWR